MKLYTKAFVEKIDKNEIIAIASSDIEDRQGEIVDVGGWDLKNFLDAPRLLWGHDHKKLPVGKVTEIWVEKSAKPKLMFKATFQEVTEFGKAVKKLFEQGFLNTFSVGFRPIDAEHDEGTKSGTRFTKQELLEISVVNVPANPEALTLAYKSLEKEGLIDEAPKVFGNTAALLIGEVENLKTGLAEAKEQINLAVKGLKYLAPHRSKHETITKRLELSKVIARAADKLIVGEPQVVSTAKIIKRTSEILIRSHKGEL